MIRRSLQKSLEAELSEYSVVTIFGPRQSGKTTLVRSCHPDFGYVSMEDKESREAAAADYKSFFANHPCPLIIDEVQRQPEIVAAVQTIVDSRRDECGQFILTGSQQTQLAEAIDESLAGRTSILDLLPLSTAELKDEICGFSTDECLTRGFMPELYAKRMRAFNYYRNYFRTYVERDVRRLVNVKNLLQFERFVTLLAGRVGQVVNFTSLANETGVSVPTVSAWLSVLEASFLVFRLPPYFSNIAKRVVKSPKVYFTDVGLAAYLLGIESPAHALAHPLRGSLFENMVVADIRKGFTNSGREPRMAFYRTEKGFEIDVLILVGGRVIPIEIKSSMTFGKNLVRNLEVYCEEDKTASSPLLIYDGDEMRDFGAHKVSARNWRDASGQIFES